MEKKILQIVISYQAPCLEGPCWKSFDKLTERNETKKKNAFLALKKHPPQLLTLKYQQAWTKIEIYFCLNYFLHFVKKFFAQNNH